MQYLIYVSAATRLMSDEELEEILKASRINNHNNNITGILLYSEGTFMQLLEGPCHAIMAAYQRIEADDRHKSIIKIAQGDLHERLFDKLSLCFKKASSKEFSRFSSFVSPGDLSLADDHLHPAVLMLKTFFDSNNM